MVNNIDPLQKGRIQVIAPDATGIVPTTWAEPCVPMAGIQQGIYMVPISRIRRLDPVRERRSGSSGVDRRLVGIGRRGAGARAAGNPATPNIVLQTTLQNTIVISDVPGPTGGIMLKSATGAIIIVNDTGIYHPERQGRESSP